MNASKYLKASIATTTTAGAVGMTTITGAALDMADYEGVLIVVPVGAIVATGVQSIKAQQGSAANLSDAADLAGTNQVIAVADADKTFYIDLVKPTKRYVRVLVTRGTANSTFGGITYLQYSARKKPPIQGTNVSGETHVSPAEGTA